MTKLTLNQIKSKDPLNKILPTILKHFDKTEADGTEVSFNQLIDIVGITGAIMCLRCLPENRKDDIVNFAADCAESVLHVFEKEYPEDDRPRKVIKAARNYKNLSEDTLKNFAADVNATYVTKAATYAAKAAAYSAYTAYSNVTIVLNVDLVVSNALKAATYAANINEREKQAEFLLKYFGD